MSWSRPVSEALLASRGVGEVMRASWKRAGLLREAPVVRGVAGRKSVIIRHQLFEVQGFDPDDTSSVKRVDRKARAILGLKEFGEPDGSGVTGDFLDMIARDRFAISRQPGESDDALRERLTRMHRSRP